MGIDTKYDILGVPYAKTNYEEASDIILESAFDHKSFAVFALPVHGLVESWDNPNMREAIRHADLICPDGQPIRWLMNRMYNARLKDRVYGPTLTLKVLEKCNQNRLSVYLYGGATQEILDRFSAFITSKYPNITLCGTYREQTPTEDTLRPEEINKAGPHLVLVGRGCPRQEIWVSQNKGKINAAMMAVGAAFSFHSGMVPQAPAWMQRTGLEWLFRLMQEPGRLWKRYLYTNTRFLIRAIPELLRSK